MQFPLIDKSLLANLRLVHGAFNITVMLLFLFQGWLGLAIRRARQNNAPLPLPVIRRHRLLGPVLFTLAVLGFIAGLTLVLLNTGNVLEYPPHLIGGTTIIILLIATIRISRDIKGVASPYRNPHYRLGIVILILYVINVLLGIVVLL